MGNLDIREITAKSILVRSGIPGVDYVINPYTGCRFACKYCYASFMGRMVGKEIGDWGNYVFAKVNAPELLSRELARLKAKGKGKEIFISSVTDPYQGLEAKYKLTRQCLTVLAGSGFAGSVSILTKSDLVTRDMDVFRRMEDVYVGMTVTSTDDSISRYFETFAPPVSKRLKALKTLNANGIKTYAFIGPLLPHFVAKPVGLEQVFRALAEVGTRDIFVEHLNLARYIRERLVAEIKGTDGDIIKTFYNSQSKSYREELTALVSRLVSAYGMRLMTDSVIFHRENRQ